MRVLITGATGFIGEHLVKKLLEDSDVRCLVRRETDIERFTKRGIDTTLGDVTDYESLKKAVAGVDVVYHLAGAISGLTRTHFHRINVLGCRKIAKAARRAKATPTVVYVSSMAAGGPAGSDKPRLEIEPPLPISQYGLTKLLGEREFSKVASDVPVTVVRPSVVYGEGDKSSLEFFKPVSNGVFYFTGEADWPFSLIDVRDLVDLLQLAQSGQRLELGETNPGIGIYNAAGPDSPKLGEFGEILAKALHTKPPRSIKVPRALITALGASSSAASLITRKPSILSLDKARELNRGPWFVSTQKAQDELGFTPKTPLQGGLERVANWYKEKGWI